MSFWVKLFGEKKKIELTSEGKIDQKIKWNGFDFFERGKGFYFNRQEAEALSNFDKAFENNFVENFQSDAAEFFDLRASCLQGLGYEYEALDNYDKAILLLPNDCNKYFSRSISKEAVLDFDGQVADLEKAIQLSEIDNELNRLYNEGARKQGYTNGIRDMYCLQLLNAKMNVDREVASINTINNAKTDEKRQFWQHHYSELRAKRLSKVKKRNI